MIHAKDPTLLSVTYLRKNKNTDQKECFEVVYLDDNGQPQVSYEPPNATIYIVKPEYRTYLYNKPQERIEHMDAIVTPISKIRQVIAENAGDWGKQITQTAYDRHEPRLLNQLYKWPWCYVCDFQPEYYFLHNWYQKYKVKSPKFSLAFLDIETDILDYMPDNDNIQDTAYAPVNVATVTLSETKEVFTFICEPKAPEKGLRSEEQFQERYAMYERQKRAYDYLISHKEEFIADLNNSFDESYGHLTYRLRFYEQEIDLIADIFRLINTRKPTFCMSWNMRFDIQYLYYRIIALGYDPTSIMTHRDFKYKRCYFKVDRMNMEFASQSDFFYCSSYTMFICQMRLYAAIRKSQHKQKSMKLNAIADNVLKDRKVDYPENSNIRTFPYVDFLRFIKYNIKDVLLQYGIESKVHDTTTYYMRSHSNQTPYNKIFKETHLLRNVREMYFEPIGWAQGNNLNIIDDPRPEAERRMYGTDLDEDESKASESYKGAINADPAMNAKIGMPIFGRRGNKLYMNLMDYDMGAFYPSIKIASNMDPMTLIAKAAFNNDEFISGEYVNRSLNQTYREKDKNGHMRDLDITGEAVNTFVGKNLTTFGYNYLNLPSIPQYYDIVARELHLRRVS